MVGEQIGQGGVEAAGPEADDQTGDVGFVQPDAVRGDEVGEVVEVGIGAGRECAGAGCVVQLM